MIIYTAEKAVKDLPAQAGNEAKLQELKDSVNAKITALRGVKDGTDGEAIKKATEELSSEMSKIGEALKKAGAAPDASAGAADGGSSPESEGGAVKDAEFKEKPPEGEAPKA